ncbi:hypothetical protein ILYODFUR_038568 [Ilyodon furcidens]|uniref:Uncharacterized protein n=1 Tax=Ilyodon furcidens TaxID=33524 RepID=A0ABV0VM53_9TELE
METLISGRNFFSVPFMCFCRVSAAVKRVWVVIPSSSACYQTQPLVVIKQGAKRTISIHELDLVPLISLLPEGAIRNNFSFSPFVLKSHKLLQGQVSNYFTGYVPDSCIISCLMDI